MARLLHLHFHLRSKTKSNPSLLLFFSTSNSNSNSFFESPSVRALRERLEKSRKMEEEKVTVYDDLRMCLQEMGLPPPQDSPPQHQISLQDICNRKMGPTAANSGGASSFNVQSIRESLQNISGKTSTSPLRRPSSLSESVFAKEMRKDGPAVPPSPSSAAMVFLKTNGVEDLGKKCRMLRPEGKGKDWFSDGDMSERLEKLRARLKEIDQSKEKDTNKASLQGISISSQLSGSPTFPLEPPKAHLVQKYFHPDNMSSAEKLKIELANVRDECKMSESDCGSARVQIAQLTTKIKHLSAAPHKKEEAIASSRRE